MKWVPETERDISFFRIIVILCLLATIATLIWGCAEARPEAPQPQGPGPATGLGAGLVHTGGLLVKWGLWATGLGLVLRVAGAFFVPVLKPFCTILGDIAEIGAISAVVGAAFIWIADYTWLVGVACAVAGLAWLVYRRAVLVRWYHYCVALLNIRGWPSGVKRVLATKEKGAIA